MARQKMKYKNKRKLNGFLYTLPWIIGFIMFFAVPIVNTIIWSFSNVGVKETGGMELSPNGVMNYISLFTEQVTTDKQTFLQLFTDENVNLFINAPIIIIFSLFLAILANMNFKGRGFVRVIFFLPIVLGLDVITEMITVTTGGDLVAMRGTGIFSQGMAARLLIQYTSLDLDIILTVTSFVDNIFDLMSQAGVQVLIYLAGLQSISPSLYEVAKIEGATTYETFWKVTLPMIGNISVFVIVYTIVDIFLSSPIAEEVYAFAFQKSKIGVASALSVVYMLNVLLILLLVLFISRKAVKS
ncbi:MAG: sugar ABC transporter permease [Lachnospiraceae bacterium]|nr:sugar ABC transporter permease [Lachnospiraceae bacterium]